MDIAQKTGASGGWQVVSLSNAPSGQVRSFIGYTDSVTGQEMALPAPMPSSQAHTTRQATTFSGISTLKQGLSVLRWAKATSA